MVKLADILINNFRPGVMDKLGLGESDCKKINDKLKIPPMKPYFDEWKFQNIDEYARHDVAGFNMWGSCEEFNTAWKEIGY